MPWPSNNNSMSFKVLYVNISCTTHQQLRTGQNSQTFNFLHIDFTWGVCKEKPKPLMVQMIVKDAVTCLAKFCGKKSNHLNRNLSGFSVRVKKLFRFRLCSSWSRFATFTNKSCLIWLLCDLNFKQSLTFANYFHWKVIKAFWLTCCRIYNR